MTVIRQEYGQYPQKWQESTDFVDQEDAGVICNHAQHRRNDKTCADTGQDAAQLERALGDAAGMAMELSRELQRVGRVPLHTLRENIDYGFAEAHTVYGKIGVKCWICKKDTDNNN